MTSDKLLSLFDLPLSVHSLYLDEAAVSSRLIYKVDGVDNLWCVVKFFDVGLTGSVPQPKTVKFWHVDNAGLGRTIRTWRTNVPASQHYRRPTKAQFDQMDLDARQLVALVLRPFM